MGLALACCAPALALAAEFVEFYKSGLAAIESQHWTSAAEMMQRAIEQQPNSRTKIKKALYFRRYLPHFYLGKALYETDDCPGALTAWQESEAQGVVQRFPEYQQILEGRLACDQMVNMEGALDAALRAVENAETSATQARRRLSGLPDTLATAQALSNRLSQAEASLGRARRRLASVDIVLSEVEEAATLAAVARGEFDLIRQEADELRASQVVVRREELTAQIQSQVVEARQALRSSEYLQPYPTMVAWSRAAVEQALEHVRAPSDGALSDGELQVVQSELARAVADLRRLVSPPPAELEDAAAAYLTRNYTGVLAILGDHEFSSTRAASHSHLLQAAALFALYYSTGASDEELLEQARGEVLACRGADRDQLSPADIFSPSFVVFFENQTLQPAASSDGEGVDKGR